MGEIPHLKNLQGRTLYVGDEKKFPRGCCSCLLGTGLTAIRKTNKCNAAMPILLRLRRAGPPYRPSARACGRSAARKFREEDIDLLLSIHSAPTGISYVYLEPFMEIEVYYGIIAQLPRGRHPPAHVHQRHAGERGKPARAGRTPGWTSCASTWGATNCADRVHRRHGASPSAYHPASWASKRP